MKRTLIIVAGIVVFLGFGVWVYFFFFASKGTLTTSSDSFLPGASDSLAPSGENPATEELGVPSAGAGTEVAPRLVRISDRPVVFGASAIFLQGTLVRASSTASTSAYATDPDVSVSYIERESGNIFDFKVHARTVTRVTNKTLPGIHDAVWSPDGNVAYVRFLERTGGSESIASYALPKASGGGFTFDKNVAQFLVVGSSSLVTLSGSGDASLATISTLGGANPKQLFASLLSRITLSSGGGTLLATTKASAKLGGYSFLVNQKTGVFTRVLGPLRGLSVSVSPSGQYILYSYVDGKQLALAVFDTKTNSAIRLPLSTLSEKCAWSSASNSLYCAVPKTLYGTLPDDWYQGALGTSDRLWRIDLGSRTATQLIDPETVGAGAVDGVSLVIDKADDVLVFTNRNDGTLWVYDL